MNMHEIVGWLDRDHVAARRERTCRKNLRRLTPAQRRRHQRAKAGESRQRRDEGEVTYSPYGAASFPAGVGAAPCTGVRVPLYGGPGSLVRAAAAIAPA